ncbi:hypothetical protein, partial [Corynebacterium sp.]|uniref:hypothetical protein n=1 Tax=Corynebacterium sp. TaxID=1720 RepID=UPI0026284C7E
QHMHTTLHTHNTVALHVKADSELITHMNQKQTGEKLSITHRSPKTVIRKQDRRGTQPPGISAGGLADQ